MELNELLKQLTLEEKAALLTGAANMMTAGIETHGIEPRKMADGPQGVRAAAEDDCTMFPALCSIGAAWDPAQAEMIGRALGEDCRAHGIDMLLGPGANLKRTPQCGRNFEYVSEDPLLSGEIAAGYIRGLQEKGVAACVKHFAMNNQEIDRLELSVEADKRTMRELYLKSFEIAVKKGQPKAVMCAYNKVHSVWCSENRYLLQQILKDEWEYDGLVVSDWGAVQNIGRALKAGLDLQMPHNKHILADLQNGLEDGTLTEADIDRAVMRVLRYVMQPREATEIEYDRQKLHRIAREAAAEGIVLLKNQNAVLPVTSNKYKKIGVVGEYAMRPLISGQGSAEVYPAPEHIDIPFEELRKALGAEVQLDYMQIFSQHEMPGKMIWPESNQWINFAREKDLVIVFAGSMASEDTEQFDRSSIGLNPNISFVIDKLCNAGTPIVVVLQSGSALILGRWKDRVSGILEMWLAGEAAGGAIADVLTGKVNPSGRLPETFPKKLREDLDYPGNGRFICYREGLEVGYRYYDAHPEQIEYPFGYGLSYSDFSYGPLDVSVEADTVHLRFTLENRSHVDGSEVVQIYAAKPDTDISRPVKELKAFKKVFVKKRSMKEVTLEVPVGELAYYNALLHEYVVEPGVYQFMLGASSQDIRQEKRVTLDGDAPYSVIARTSTMVG